MNICLSSIAVHMPLPPCESFRYSQKLYGTCTGLFCLHDLWTCTFQFSSRTPPTTIYIWIASMFTKTLRRSLPRLRVEGLVCISGTRSNFASISLGLSFTRRLRPHVKQAEDSAYRFANFVGISVILIIQDFQGFDHVVHFVDPFVKVVLLVLQLRNKIIGIFEGALSILAKATLADDGFQFGSCQDGVQCHGLSNGSGSLLDLSSIQTSQKDDRGTWCMWCTGMYWFDWYDWFIHETKQNKKRTIVVEHVHTCYMCIHFLTLKVGATEKAFAVAIKAKRAIQERYMMMSLVWME